MTGVGSERRHYGCAQFAICFPAGDLPTLVVQVGRLFLATYMVLFLSLSGLIYVERWSEGAHVTPEMWAEHMQLVRMGYENHHHGHDAAVDHMAHTHGSATANATLPFVPVWSSLPQFPLALEWTPYLAAFDAFLIAALIIVGLVLSRADHASKDYLPPTPHRPPIVVS